MTCELCDTVGGELVWKDDLLRVVYVDEPGYIGYCRVIWNTHMAEMTDLDVTSRAHCMRVVFAVESLLRELLNPDKINLASLGNFTPHVHWHVIARFHDDAHFPQAIWGTRQREALAPPADGADLPQRLATRLQQVLTTHFHH
jgi:diadenosine tetraphosphate (Ap4A) HIT family hydrolase